MQVLNFWEDVLNTGCENLLALLKGGGKLLSKHYLKLSSFIVILAMTMSAVE